MNNLFSIAKSIRTKNEDWQDAIQRAKFLKNTKQKAGSKKK